MKLSLTHIQQQVMELIMANGAGSVALTPETNFVKSGILDSFAILSMIMQIENQFAIKFELAELANTALQTVDGLSQAIAAKLD